MANVIFNRSDNALAEPVEDGKLTFSTNGDGKMYLDKGNRRLEMGGARTIDAYPSKESVNAIQNKAVTNNFIQNTDVVNNLQSAISVTEDSIPCGTKVVKEMNNKLRVNNTDFIFDYQNGEFGYNTDPKRGADTFHPFRGIKYLGYYSDRSFSLSSYGIPSSDFYKYSASDLLVCPGNGNWSPTEVGVPYFYKRQSYSNGVFSFHCSVDTTDPAATGAYTPASRVIECNCYLILH